MLWPPKYPTDIHWGGKLVPCLKGKGKDPCPTGLRAPHTAVERKRLTAWVSSTPGVSSAMLSQLLQTPSSSPDRAQLGPSLEHNSKPYPSWGTFLLEARSLTQESPEHENEPPYTAQQPGQTTVQS